MCFVDTFKSVEAHGNGNDEVIPRTHQHTCIFANTNKVIKEWEA
jgi:hypothetical protein